MNTLRRTSAPSEAFYFTFGIVFSAVAHLFCAGLFVFFLQGNPSNLAEPEVYSISIESGQNLGGISQVPKDESRSPVVPPKAQVPTAVETAAPLPTNDAEVSLATPVPTARPNPTAIPKATPRATPKPTKGPTPTPRPPTKAETDRDYQKLMQRYLGESAQAGGKGFGAARQGGEKGMGGGTLRPPEFFRYRDLLEAYVKGGWRWVGAETNLRARVVFDIAPDGTVSNVRIVEGSGNQDFDDSILRAVYKASPVPKPPDTVYEFFKQVRIEFKPE